jgi:hypothetical protein
MLMTVWAEALEANPRAASPAKRLSFNFMAAGVLVFCLLGCRGAIPFSNNQKSGCRKKIRIGRKSDIDLLK